MGMPQRFVVLCSSICYTLLGVQHLVVPLSSSLGAFNQEVTEYVFVYGSKL